MTEERYVVFIKGQPAKRLCDKRQVYRPSMGPVKYTKAQLEHFKKQIFSDLDVVLESDAPSWMLNLV